MGLANEKIVSQIEDLLQGKVVIPSIQRDFVWMRPDVRDLFDSLYRDYPVGALTIVPALLLHHRDGKLRPGEAQLLRRWVYTAMAFSHYSLQVEGKLDAEARLIKSREGEGLFAELIRRASGTRSRDSALHPRDLEQKYSTHPFFKLLYIAALRDTARDWATNIAISDQPMNSGAEIEFHHVFPRARVQGTYAKEEWNSLANLAFVTGQTNKMISSRLPVDYMAGIAPERLAEQWIPGDPELRSLDRFPDFLAARRSLLANVLNELLGLPRYDAQATHRDTDELPADEQLIVEGPTAPTLVGAAVQELRTKHGVEIHVTYEGQRVDAYYDPASLVPRREDPLRSGSRRVRDSQRGGGRLGPRPEPVRQSESERMDVLDRHRHRAALAEHPVAHRLLPRLGPPGVTSRGPTGIPWPLRVFRCAHEAG
jgi:hypothetical protein